MQPRVFGGQGSRVQQLALTSTSMLSSCCVVVDYFGSVGCDSCTYKQSKCVKGFLGSYVFCVVTAVPGLQSLVWLHRPHLKVSHHHPFAPHHYNCDCCTAGSWNSSCCRPRLVRSPKPSNSWKLTSSSIHNYRQQQQHHHLQNLPQQVQQVLLLTARNPQVQLRQMPASSRRGRRAQHSQQQQQ